LRIAAEFGLVLLVSLGRSCSSGVTAVLFRRSRCSSVLTARGSGRSIAKKYRVSRHPVSTTIWTALAWCLGILIVTYVLAMATYRRRITQ
jgi:hypothetical protein